jgi:acetyl esterase/lipase
MAAGLYVTFVRVGCTSDFLTYVQCTGAADFIPWYSQTAVQRAQQKKAIIIAPNYPLGPEGNYDDIYEAIYDFLKWYKEDGYFKKDAKDTDASWQDWLCGEIEKKGKKLTIAKEHVYVEGESAGAHAAVTAMWLNASTEYQFNIPIQAALLRYPMIAHYERTIKPGEQVPYIGGKHELAHVQERAKLVEDEILRLEGLGIVPTCTKRSPPRGMAFAVFLSVSHRWQSLFQREHGESRLRGKQDVDEVDEGMMDGVERAERCARFVNRDLLPPIYIYHGHDDGNCLPIDTEQFVDLLRRPSLYEDRFQDDNTLCLDIVRHLNKKPRWNPETKRLEYVWTKEVGHGFDYYLSEEDEPFLKKAYDWVGSRWGA